jgi:chromosome segregation ATPase
MIAGVEAKMDGGISAITAADKQYADIAKTIAALETKLDRGLRAVAAADSQRADIAKRLAELDAGIDRSLSSLSGQLDGVVQQQDALAGQFGEMQRELNFFKMRLESIREKLEVPPVPPSQRPITNSEN